MTIKDVEELESVPVGRCVVCEKVLLEGQQLVCSGACHTELKEAMLRITKGLQVAGGFDAEMNKHLQEAISYWEKQ
ncbi:MAG: hypothetical protein E6R04_11295 [Spirochaetes bacterium]|nr:MAG: hypothetical protein E6R04_11295 [Spirochaetota bacterium]